MTRALAASLRLYTGLSMAQWGHAARCIHAPPGDPRRGNAVADPFLILVGVVAPLAAVGSAALSRRCLRSRHWPAFAVAAPVASLAASTVLAVEGGLPRRDDHGFILPRRGVRWLPGVGWRG